jgi:flagellar operon protein
MDSVVNVSSLLPPVSMDRSAGGRAGKDPETSGSFETLLNEATLKCKPVHFSRHAAERVERRGIQLDSQDLDRLGAAIQKARDKGSKSTLILMDGRAFIVGAKSGTVVTVAGKEDLTSQVFTNIDATVLA